MDRIGVPRLRIVCDALRGALAVAICVPTLGWGIALTPRGASAGSVSGGVGADYSSGPNGQTTKGGLGFVTLLARSADVTAIGARFDDSTVGKAVSGTLNLGVPLHGAERFRVIGTRVVGDETFRAWRVKGGPQLALQPDVSLGVFYSRYEDNAGRDADIVSAEVSAAVIPRLSAQASAGYGRATGDLNGGQGTLGLTWSAARHLVFLSEVGVGQEALITSTSSQSRGLLDNLPLVGRGPQSKDGAPVAAGNEVVSTAYLGLRILVP